MVAEEIKEKATLKAKISGLAVSYIVFLIVYNFSGWCASNTENIESIVFNFEYNIPFLSWMIIPYMTSGLLFGVVFFICSYRDELLLLTKRINFITIVSGVCFIFFPLKYSFLKPEIDPPVLSFFYQFLNTWDTNFNQAPSLHISYACIFWSVLRTELSGMWKKIAALWLLIMGISTLAVYQHHLIDIIAALLLVCVTFLIFPSNKDRNYRIGFIYFLLSAILTLVALFVYQHISIYGLLILWASVSLFLVGIAYFNSNARFLKRKDGTISIINKVIYFPYIFAYKIMRRFVCKNAKHPVTEVSPRIFIGAILNSAQQVEEFGIDRKTIVIDLSAELEENKIVRQDSAYYSCPMLDIGMAKKEDIESILNLLSKVYANLKPDEKIYIHCLMGYSRSVFIATVLIRNQLNISMGEAIATVYEKYPQAVFPQYLLDLSSQNYLLPI